jgi:hypothetical protein
MSAFRGKADLQSNSLKRPVLAGKGHSVIVSLLRIRPAAPVVFNFRGCKNGTSPRCDSNLRRCLIIDIADERLSAPLEPLEQEP